MEPLGPAVEHALRAWQLRRDSPHHARALAHQAWTALENAGTSPRLRIARIMCLLAPADLEIQSGDPEQARSSANQAVRVARQLGDPAWLVRALRVQAIACHHVGAFTERLLLLREAVAHSATLTDGPLVSSLYVDAACAEVDLERHQYALELLDIAETSLNPESMSDAPAPFALIAANRARVLRMTDRAREGLIIVEHALRALPLAVDHLYRTYLETEQQRCLMELGEEVSEQRLQQLAARCARRDWWLVRDDLLRLLARRIADHDPDRAVELAREAVQCARSGGDTRDRVDGLHLLATLLRDNGRAEEAATMKREAAQLEAETETLRLRVLAELACTRRPARVVDPGQTPPPQFARRPDSPFDAHVLQAIHDVQETAQTRSVSVEMGSLRADDVRGGADRLQPILAETVLLLVRSAPAGTRMTWSTYSDEGWCYLRCEAERPQAKRPRMPGDGRGALERVRTLCHQSDGWVTSDAGPGDRLHLTMAWRRTGAFCRVDTL